jgi:acetyl coenzyme A synthetase (ADP forming)-like protein
MLVKEKKVSEIIYDKLFNPGSIAVIGASRKPNSVGNAIFKNIAKTFKGKIYPINKNAPFIEGRECYPSLNDIDNDIDLAVIMVPRHCVAESLTECGEKGIKFVVVISAGFKETGEEGLKYEEEIKKIAERYSIALIGPNCLGIINTGAGLNTTFAARAPKKGNISFISQSGAVGVYALEFAAANDIGFSKFVSIGNKTIINENNILKYLHKDEATRVILLYLESFSDPKEFIRIASKITQGPDAKPVLLIKSARSTSGKRAAISHTGALAGSDEMIDDLMLQCGIVRAKNMEELFNYALCFANQPLPKGSKVVIVTNAGGPGIMAADDAEREGLIIPELSEDLQGKLRKRLSSKVCLKNPVDLIGDADAIKYKDALEVLTESDETDSILVLCTPQMMTNLELIAIAVADVSEKARKNDKTLVTSFAAFDDPRAINKIFDSKNIPNFPFTGNAVEAVAAAAKFNDWLKKPRNSNINFKLNGSPVRSVINDAISRDVAFLTEPESYKVFEAYGISVAGYNFCNNIEEALKSAGKIGYPLALKIVSHDVVHKFDVGGVILNINNESELREAYSKIIENVRKNKPGAIIDGILLQEMVRDGVEVITGVKYDSAYGHIIMFGLGGTYVEIFKDVKFRLAPINCYDAEEMITGIKSFKILSGYRGKPARDIEALRDLLLRISRLITDFPVISEIDLNPVFALDKGVKVADARIILGKH